MRHVRLAFALFLLMAAPLSANAVPIIYQIKFVVTEGTITTLTYGQDLNAGPTLVNTDATGRVYLGLFSVDSEILLTDGIAKPADVGFFFIEMEDTVWAYNLSVPFNSFAGFRGPGPDCESHFCFAASPGVDVMNGAIVGLRGGIYGKADHPYVDFSPPYLGLNEFGASGSSSEHEPAPGAFFRFVDYAYGTIGIVRVSEPSTPALVVFALVALAVMRKRRVRRL